MKLHCVNCLMFTKNYSIKLKREIDGKSNLHSCCNDCGFKRFQTIVEEDLGDLLKALI